MCSIAAAKPVRLPAGRLPCGAPLLQILITDQANGLPQLLDQARTWLLVNDEPAALKARS
jgi:hypothetical protein